MKTERITFGSEGHEVYVRYLPDSCTGVEPIIYCHGGAFCQGSCEDNSEFLEMLAGKASMPVYSVGFRGIDDARMLDAMVGDITAAINAIVRETASTAVHIVGDSSGAYLALVTLLKALNRERFETQADFTVKSAILICGYLEFRDNDAITNYLSQYPAYQYLPKELRKLLEIDYSELNLPHMLLITGDKDGCREDMVSFSNRVNAMKPSANTRIIVAESTEDAVADHCFPIYKTKTEIGENALNEMASFLKRKATRIVTIDEVNDIQLRLFIEYASEDVGSPITYFSARSMTSMYRERLRTDNGDLWCLLDNGMIIGILGMRVLAPDTAELRTFRMLKKCRNNALEDLLIAKAITRAREAGFGQLVIDLDNPRVDSLRVFTSAGFEYAGRKEYFPYAGEMMALTL